MSDINALLKTAAPDAGPPDAGVVDGDLARGRAALAAAHRRRRVRRAAFGSVWVAALAVVAALAAHSALTGPGGRLGHSRSAAGTGRAGAHVSASAQGGGHARIRLVDYAGAQLPGFTVDRVPVGWHLSTSTSTALLITPNGSTNNQPDDFEGKLAVLTSSVDQHGLGPGAAVTVDGRPGRVRTSTGVLMLTYNAPTGFGVVIQAPGALGWGAAQIVAFAEGVHVTPNAVHGHG